MKKNKSLLLLLVFAIVISAVVTVSVSAADNGKNTEAPYEYVVVLGVDGMGNFSKNTDTPNMDAIFEGGATTDYALVENPSSSAEGWASLLIGVPCDVHGLTNYTIQEGAYTNDKLPTIFKLLKNQKPDAKAVSFCSWNYINKGIVENIDGVVKEGVADKDMGAKVESYVSENGVPNLLYCQFNNSDAVGHASGFGGAEHLQCITETDAYIGEVYNVYKDAGVLDKTLFIVTADHGGRSTTHGGWTDGEKYVFYGVAGEGVNETSELEMFIRDTPAIVCYALGLKGTEGWDSYIPKNLFTDNMNPLSRPASAPELICPSTTPGADSERYIGNYIDITELRAGFFFDGDLSNFVSGSDVTLGRYVGEFSQNKAGTIYYPTGLYSSGVKVSYEGYLATDDLKLDNNSFSIGLWVNLNNMTADQPIWSTKIWSKVDDISGSEQAGLMIRNYYKDTKHYLGYSIGSGAYSVDGVAQTPSHGNYNYDDKNFYEPNKWVHTLMVLDRASGTLNYYINFELARSVKLSNYAWFTEDYDIDPHDIFAIGQDATGAYGKALEGIVDDLLIWDSAVDANTVAGLKAYYYNASYDYDFSYSGEPVISTTPSNEVAVGEYFTNTDNTPYVKLEATVLGEKLNSSAKYEINNSFILSDYKNPKFYVIDFDISTASNYLPMNFVSVILGNSGTDSLESAYNRITADGVLVGSLDGYEITRTLSISPFDWQHITMVYDLVDGEDGYPLYIYFNGDLISNSEWINASDKQNGKTPAAISKTQILAEQFVTNANNYATTLIANATSALYTDDEYGNLEAFFCSGASMLESNKIFDLTYGKDYVLPKPDNMYSTGGAAYREFADALSKGNGTIDLLHSDFHKTYTVSEPCTVNTNGYKFNYETSSAVSFAKSTDNSGNDVYTFSAISPLYTITDSDGAVKRYYENQSFEALLSAAANGSTIKLFTNIENSKVDLIFNNKRVDVDLNGYTLTNTGSIRLWGANAELNFYGGTIANLGSRELIYANNEVPGCVATFTDCTITSAAKFADLRQGTLKLIDCTYTQSGGNDFATIASAGKQGDYVLIEIDGSTMNLGSARFVYSVRVASYPAAVHIDITINNSDIKTTSNLFYLQNTTKDDESTTDVIEGAEGSTTDIVIKGNSKISSSKLDGGELTVPKTTLTLGLGSSFKSEPTIKGATLLFSDGASTVSNNEGSEYPYTVSKALYTITSADGTVKEYGDVQTLEALLSAAANGSTIKLFTNIENSKVDLIFNNKRVDVDLNGYTLTNTGSIRLWGANAELNFYGGTIANLGSRELIYANNEVPGCVATFTDCTITSAAKFADLRQGTLKLIDCTYTQSGGNDFATVASAGKQGDYVLIEIDGSTMNLGSARFVYSVRVASYPAAAKITVLVNNSEIKTKAALFYFQNTTSDDESTTDVIEGAPGSSTDVIIKGNSRISCSQFESGGKTVPKTTLTLGLGSMFTVEPTISGVTTAFSDGGTGIGESGDSIYLYEVFGKVYYTVTKNNGSVTNVYKISTLSELISLADSGSVIKLNENVEMSAEISLSNKNIEINLNNFTLTTSDQFRLSGNTLLYVHGGTVSQVGTANFVFVADGNSSSKLKVEKCSVNIKNSFANMRSGSVEIVDSDCKNTSGNTFILSADGSATNLILNNSSFELGTALLASMQRYYEGASTTTVTINNCTVVTESNLFTMTNNYSADISKIRISLTGDKTKLSYRSFDGDTCNVSDTIVTIGLGVKMNKLPSVAIGQIMLGDGAKGFAASGDSTYPYVVSNKSSLPAKTYLTLTLYSDFTINLCFLESEWDCIVKVVCDGNEIKPSKSNGMVFYPIKGIAPYNAADTKSITVTYKYQDITLDAVVECSVIAYAKRLLESDYSNESKALISRAVDYVKTVYEYAGFEIPTSVIDIISSDAYQAISTDGILSEIPQSSTSAGGISTVIESVQFLLDSEFSFRFNIKSGVNTSLTVKTRTMNETFEIVNGMCGEKRYIIVNMRAFDMYDGVISFSTPDASGTYDFKAYANSPAHDKDTTGMTQKTLLSLYNYCKKASEYSKVQDQDFRAFASVVVKNGKSGTVTYVVDDGRADTAERLEPMLDEYENLKLTFALIATKYATLNTAYNETTGKYEYVLDSNGKYTYKVNEEAAAYWRELIDNYNGRVEYANHTFTHNFAGYDDEGGTVSYVNNNGEIVTVNLPVGSATAEVAAAIQVLNELFGVDVKTLVDPGFSANKTDVTIDGVTYPGYLAYYLEICRQLYEDGILIGSRGNGFAESMLNPSYVVTPEMFKDASARLNITSFTVKDFDSVESWKTYIDYATASGGWANFCIHQIFEDGTVSSAFHLKESQAKELFSYTNRDDVWVANYEEACKYYAEWSTSQVNAEYSNGKITVTLTDSENNEVYDEALTVKVTIPSSWSKCLVNGSTATVIMTDETGASYVYVDIVPDSGSVVLSEK